MSTGLPDRETQPIPRHRALDEPYASARAWDASLWLASPTGNTH